MANAIIPYEDAHGTKYGATQDQAAENLLNDYVNAQGGITRTAPFGNTYATLADLQAVSGWSGAIALPTNLTPRKMTFAVSDNAATSPPATPANLTSLTVIVGDVATWDYYFPTGATPLPAPFTHATKVQLAPSGCTGESRSV